MFEPSAHYVTCNLLDPDPDLAARALGFPFRDITGRARFAHAIRALNEDARP